MMMLNADSLIDDALSIIHVVSDAHATHMTKYTPKCGTKMWNHSNSNNQQQQQPKCGTLDGQ